MESSDQTPRVLKQCLELFDSPKHEQYSMPIEVNIRDKYNHHPDIQYFKSIKSRNHFTYHKYKRTPTKSAPASLSLISDFDPFSRTLLLERLSTFSSLNWSIPLDTDHELNELKCAQNGWKCISIAINNVSKNHLLCTSCKKLLSLRFNEFSEESSELDLKNCEDLNCYLAEEYIHQVKNAGHSVNCPWRNFETPLEGVYYVKPFIESTNETLINTYLSCLKSLVDNHRIIADKQGMFTSTSPSSERLKAFVRVSNNWILKRYYGDNKTDKSMILDHIPSWIYDISLHGWDLKVQSFSNHLVLFLVCSDCNKKVFLDYRQHPPINKDIPHVPVSTGLDLSTSKILTPVKYPSNLTSSVFTKSCYDIVEEEEEEEEIIDLYSQHKCWCSRKLVWNNQERISDYLFNLIIRMETRIGPDGEYLGETDSTMYTDDESCKRRVSFDVADGLERLNKLRKLYLVDD
ncbi:hypothetical protein PSN45_001379 [Yamadazyma tenuis]|uniref:Zf-C3HC-domain-containing protein n=1 Tax=Candida tenuis (strain ATCC 10573 / BCRC 21748 / CBS 615 / JCM 9827 / NBRC 10315 / NRRL Y-1498 / VKM Y-70) TaxID=590646 RepID=G3BCG1_CANTC|nr:zf-C3HC-domain-containing protein [Yamadazyma tenuis ATCC 10573]EGV60827.1 zf-C3HC-domain-containing protein [Yamadazyma tenuis ATCC 10573]WEJ93902.1 hypothetical protein PSN45_001379 [Yamadazyma tenuis]